MSPFAKFVVAATLGLAAAGSAQAADLPARVAPAPYVAPLPIFTWTGAYFGINAGAAFDAKQVFTTTADRSDGIGNTNFSDSGFSAGGQIGYNYEIPGFGGFGGPGSGIVVGFEADAMYMDTDKSINETTNNGTASFRSGLNFLGTARGRLGYAFNQFLVYGTGRLRVWQRRQSRHRNVERVHLHRQRERLQHGLHLRRRYRIRSADRVFPELLPLECRDAQGGIPPL